MQVNTQLTHSLGDFRLADARPLQLLQENAGVQLPNEEDGCTVTLCITDRQTDIHYTTTTT